MVPPSCHDTGRPAMRHRQRPEAWRALPRETKKAMMPRRQSPHTLPDDGCPILGRHPFSPSSLDPRLVPVQIGLANRDVNILPNPLSSRHLHSIFPGCTDRARPLATISDIDALFFPKNPPSPPLSLNPSLSSSRVPCSRSSFPSLSLHLFLLFSSNQISSTDTAGKTVIAKPAPGGRAQSEPRDLYHGRNGKHPRRRPL